MAIPRKDSFLRAGEIWMKIWTFLGLTCLTVKDSSVRISKIKVLYSAVMVVVFCVVSYYRYKLRVIDTDRPIESNVRVYSACSSVICSALMIALAMWDKKREAIFFSKTFAIRKKYLLKSPKSILHYFPLSSILPCITLVLENISFTVFSASQLKLILILSYSFSIYSFLFQSQIHYYSTMIEDGFRNLNDRLKVLEGTAARDKRDDAVKELRGFRLMYHELSNHSKYMNELFSSRVILTVGYNFAIGVLFTFRAIVVFINPAEATRRVLYTLILSYWALCCFLNLFVLAQPCEKIRKEALYTPIAVHSLSTRLGYKTSFYDELRLFSSQLVLEGIQQAPHRFLILNNRMLLSTLGAVSSSLVILLQMTIVKN